MKTSSNTKDLDCDIDDVYVDRSSPTIVLMASGSMSVQVSQHVEEEVHTSLHSVQSRIEPISQEIVQEVQDYKMNKRATRTKKVNEN